MTMRDTRHVKGLSDLQKFLDALTPKLERNVMRGAMRAGVREIRPAAKANIHSVSGELARSLDARGAIRTGSKGGRVYAKLVAGTGFGVKGKPPRNLPIWVEFGTRAHAIRARAGRSLMFLGGIFAKAIQHPGARPRPFMRPAMDARAAAAVVAAAEYVKKRLATKHGIDTSHISVEGETE
jgi:HK97 gp10 family phage protein